jgi:ketosteroid isomerase-like protein
MRGGSAMQESPELRGVVEGYYAAAMEGNTDWVADTLSDSDAALAIGTDPAEWWEGGATIRRMWAAQLEAGLGGAKLEPTRLRAYEEGDVGWATDQPRVVLPNGNRVSMRITAVFRRENGKWRWIHSHASIGVPNQDAIGMELPT